MRRFIVHFFCLAALGALVAPALAQDWKQIGSLPGAIRCGFFFDTQSGFVGCDTLFSFGSPPWILSELRPALFKTSDGGSTWTPIILPTNLQNGFGSITITSISMRDRKDGWFSIGLGSSPSLANGIYKTIDSGNTWLPVDSPLYNSVRSSGSTLYVSDGGIALMNDSVCMTTGAIISKPPNPGSLIRFTYVTTDAGNSWSQTPLVAEAWGAYAQRSSGIFFVYPEGYPVTIGNVTIDSNQLWYSLDTGRTWRPGGEILPFAQWLTVSGDIEGDANAIYVQSIKHGMFRSMDRGQTWKSVGGPSNQPDTRFCVIPSCNGGTVIAFDTAGGVWLTTDGGDGKLAEPWSEAISMSAVPTVKACEASRALTKVFSNACPNGFTLTSAKLEGDTIHFSLDSVPPMPLSFGGGASDSFYVRFIPNKVAGSFSTKLHITGMINQLDTSLAFDTVINIQATATPIPPQLASADSTINFGALTKCTGVAERDTSVLFTNTGCAPDTITSLVLTGAGFSGANDSLPIIVPPGDSVTFEYHFVPPDSGAFSGIVKLHVTSMGLTEDPEIALTGRGIQGMGALDVRSTSLQAGSFSFCAGDTTLTDTLRNTGCDTLVISNIRFGGDSAFTLLSQPDSLLLPGASGVFQLYFSPRVKGAHSATLTFHSRNIVNDPGFDTTLSLSGIGLPGTTALSADTTARDFGALFECEERDTTIWLSNPGCDTLRVDSALFSTGTYGIYRMDTTFPIFIAGNDSVAVRVHLTSTASTMNGAVTFYSNANTGLGTGTVPLRAAAIPPAQLKLTLSPAQSGKDGQVVTFYLILSGDTGAAAKELQSITFDLTHNDDLLSYLNASGLTETGKSAGTAPLHFSASPIPVSDTIGAIAFRVYLTDSSTTPLTLSNISLSTPGFEPDCIASIDDSASGFTYLYQCGEHLLQDAMLGVPFTIESIIPNPATATLRVKGRGQGVKVELDDALGRSVLPAANSFTLYPLPFTLNVSGLPSGTYFLRFSQNGYVQTRQVSIEH